MALSERIRQNIEALSETIRLESAHPAETSALLREILDQLAGGFAGKEAFDRIDAPNAVIELIDQETGLLYRRYLELEFHENDNGIQIIGEDLAGTPARIVFLSNKALEKIHDLQGMGLNAPRCDH